MNNSVYVNDFQRYLAEFTKKSDNTIASYTYDVKHFLNYIEETGLAGTLDVTKKDVERYVDWSKKTGKSNATISRSITSLKAFYRYIVQSGGLDENPAEHVATAKIERKLPQVLTEHEVELLLNQPKCTDMKSYRDKAMLELLYATGIKVSELIALNKDDIDLINGFIFCQRSGKWHAIPLYRAAVNAISEYLAMARRQMLWLPTESALFVNMSGERMSRQGFWGIVKYYQEKAGISKEISPYTLRHSFAVTLLDNGADQRSVQAMLGYADINSVKTYARIAKKQFRAVYDRVHPRACYQPGD